ncbi:COX15/CtaA family protein [Stieleria varia]|uniref:Heme A synthase n=1 Tax=Stieleria varia TaxID=2528005 RepID=A0A5C6A574_9BACT|nr:COX15/CtaA family protein [Stieleria varia]TWT94576.1 Heme A synthase [Stieleria varia]
MSEYSPTTAARWLHRLSLLSVCLVWPLIWVGGLVTTYDAGMAVPDWPNTYGYNLFLYPLSTWISGPFDLLIEHGHRLLGAVVGVVAISMLIASIIGERRRWVTGLTIAILLAVISQGALGGVRVVFGDRTLAMIHGCFGPVVFALCGVAVVVTSRRWFDRKWNQKATAEKRRTLGRSAVFLAFAPVLLSYAQLVLGAQLRHVTPMATTGFFTMTVAMHIVTAFVLWVLVPLVYWRLARCGDLTLSRPAAWLVGFVTIQILLGTGTWIVNYGWPHFLRWLPGSTGFLVQAKGFVDSIVVTAHVAMGSLILATAAAVFVQTLRTRYLAQSNIGETVGNVDGRFSGSSEITASTNTDQNNADASASVTTA